MSKYMTDDQTTAYAVAIVDETLPLRHAQCEKANKRWLAYFDAPDQNRRFWYTGTTCAYAQDAKAELLTKLTDSAKLDPADWSTTKREPKRVEATHSFDE